MKPSVGRIVHYVSYGTPGGEYKSECRAAVVTEVDATLGSTSKIVPETIGLAVLNPSGLFFHPIAEGGCRHDEDSKRGGTWHWPERVEEG